MAIDFTKPATTDNYSTAFVPNIQANQTALAQWLDSSIVTITGTPPTNAKRYNRTSSAVEEYNGAAWAPLKFHGLTWAIGNLIGIGVATALKRLHLGDGSGASEMIRFATTGASFDVGATAAGLEFTTGNNQSFLWTNNAALRMTLDTAGRLLLNRASDSGLGVFQVAGITADLADLSGAGNVRLRVRSTGAANAASLLLQNATSGTSVGNGYEVALATDGVTATHYLPTGGFEWSAGGALRMRLSPAGVFTVASSGSIANWGSSTVAGSYSVYYKGATTTPVGYIGTDGGAILGGGSGLNFGVRAEGDLLLLAGAGTIVASISSAGLFSLPIGSNAIWSNFDSTNANGGYMRFQRSSVSIGDIGTGAQIVSGGGVNDFGINVRGANKLILGVNSVVMMQLGTTIADAAGNELGFKGLPAASVTTGAFIATDRGKCVYATAGVTVPNSTMAAGDVVVIQNTTGSAITITATIATLRQTGTANTGNRTLAPYGSCAIKFGSSVLGYISGDVT